jgi:hypothetical protein
MLFLAYFPGWSSGQGKTMLNRGHDMAQRSMSSCITLERRPRRLGGSHRTASSLLCTLEPEGGTLQP